MWSIYWTSTVHLSRRLFGTHTHTHSQSMEVFLPCCSCWHIVCVLIALLVVKMCLQINEWMIKFPRTNKPDTLQICLSQATSCRGLKLVQCVRRNDCPKLSKKSQAMKLVPCLQILRSTKRFFSWSSLYVFTGCFFHCYNICPLLPPRLPEFWPRVLCGIVNPQDDTECGDIVLRWSSLFVTEL